MDLQSVITDIEIVHKVIEQWQRTGRLSEVERAFLLDKLEGIREAVEGANAECKMQNAKCKMPKDGSEDETAVLETFDILEVAEVPASEETSEIAETPDEAEASDIAETAGVADDADAPEATHEERSATDIPRRRKLGREAIRSLYGDDTEDDASADDAGEEAENSYGEFSDEAPAEKSEPEKPSTGKAAPPRQTNFAAHKKAVLGDVINQGGRTVAETIAPQAKKKIEAEKVTDLRKAMGVNDRYLIIRDLFEGDADAFDEAVARLDGFDDLNDAMLFIHDSYRWDHDSDGARLLIDIIVRKLM